MHETNIDRIRNSINCINIAVLGGANDKQYLKSTERPLDVREDQAVYSFSVVLWVLWQRQIFIWTEVKYTE